MGQKERLKEIFETIIDSNLRYEGSIKNIDFYGTFCKAAAKDHLYKVNSNNICMFNLTYEGDESVLFIFALPITPNEDSQNQKSVSERVMEIVSDLEETFITIDYLKTYEVKEEKFVYMVCIKRVK
jgi:hypothetical protein